MSRVMDASPEFKDVLSVVEVRRMAKEGELGRRFAELGLSVAEVARLLGVTQAGVSRWKNGSRRPNWGASVGLARLLFHEVADELTPTEAPLSQYYAETLRAAEQTEERLREQHDANLMRLRREYVHETALLRERIDRLEKRLRFTDDACQRLKDYIDATSRRPKHV